MTGRPWIRRGARQVARTVCHGYPLMSGMGRIANSAPFRYLAEEQETEVVADLRGGGKVRARLDDFVGRSVFFFGDLDPKVRWICKRILRPGDVVVDVGANIGMVTMMAARLVGATGHVYAVEPQVDLAEQVALSARLNGYRNVSVHAIALSDTSGQMTLVVPIDNAGAASLVGGQSGRTATVNVERTDAFLRSIGVGDVRLLKIDVEGHEAAVIAGATSALQASGPDVVLFEEHGSPAHLQASVRLIQDFGYEVFAIPRAKFRLRLTAVTDSPYAHDFVAVRRDSRGRQALRDLRSAPSAGSSL